MFFDIQKQLGGRGPQFNMAIAPLVGSNGSSDQHPSGHNQRGMYR